MTSERRKAQILFGIGVFILIACTFSTLHENNNRDKPMPVEVPKIEKLTPAPILILSSTASAAIQSPKIMLKEKSVIHDEKKIEIPEPKIEDQKRLEPPVPQEPEVKVDQHADIDPQALRKEDKELQKDLSHVAANSASTSKKDDGLAKQEKVLEQLEQQHQEQKLILEQQKQILEELKQHKESHEEMKRNELLEKQENSKKSEMIPTPAVVKPDTEVQPVRKTITNDALIVQKEPEVNKENKPNAVFDKKPDLKSTSFKNISIPKQKLPQNVEEIRPKIKVENLNVDENIVPKNQYINVKKLNDTHDDKQKQDIQKSNKNLTASIIHKKNPSILNIPSSVKDNMKFNRPEDDKNSEIHVKHRETLAKKPDFEVTVSLPKENINAINKDGT